MGEAPIGYVSVWERVGFKDGEPVSWERSMDKGKTWEPVRRLGGPIPFVLINGKDDVTQVVQVKLEAIE